MLESGGNFVRGSIGYIVSGWGHLQVIYPTKCNNLIDPNGNLETAKVLLGSASANVTFDLKYKVKCRRLYWIRDNLGFCMCIDAFSLGCVRCTKIQTVCLISSKDIYMKL